MRYELDFRVLLHKGTKSSISLKLTLILIKDKNRDYFYANKVSIAMKYRVLLHKGTKWCQIT